MICKQSCLQAKPQLLLLCLCTAPPDMLATYMHCWMLELEEVLFVHLCTWTKMPSRALPGVRTLGAETNWDLEPSLQLNIPDQLIRCCDGSPI